MVVTIRARHPCLDDVECKWTDDGDVGVVLPYRPRPACAVAVLLAYAVVAEEPVRRRVGADEHCLRIAHGWAVWAEREAASSPTRVIPSADG